MTYNLFGEMLNLTQSNLHTSTDQPKLEDQLLQRYM